MREIAASHAVRCGCDQSSAKHTCRKARACECTVAGGQVQGGQVGKGDILARPNKVILT